MHVWVIASYSVILTLTAASIDGFVPYVSPIEYRGLPRHLFKRQACQGGSTNCGAFGNTEACCPIDQTCAQDAGGNVACCPIGAACTGTIGGAADGDGAAESTGPVLIAGSSPSGLATESLSLSVTSAFLFPSITTNEGPSPPQSTVPGAIYPFVYIPTTFDNAGECSSYATSCSQQYESCLASLNGGVNGVTVSGAGVGITVQGAPTAVPGASSICQSLSAVACYGLQTEICPQFGGATAAETGFVANVAAFPRATVCPGLMYAVGAGAMAGVAGAII